MSNRITISRWKNIRTEVDVDASFGTAAVVGERRETIAIDLLEVLSDGPLASGVVGTEPGPVPCRASRDTLM